MPALGKAKKQAQNAVCQSNMKTQGLAISMYLQENDGAFPTDTYNTIFSTEDYALFSSSGVGGPAITAVSRYKEKMNKTFMPTGMLIPYVGTDEESNVCPTFASEYRRQNKAEVSYSYSYNWWLGANKISKDSMVKTPATTFWAGEETIWNIYDENGKKINGATINDNSLCTVWPMSYDTLKTLSRNDFPPYSGTYTDCLGDFHKGNAYASSQKQEASGGTTNAVCLDGHVEEVSPMDTYEYANGL